MIKIFILDTEVSSRIQQVAAGAIRNGGASFPRMGQYAGGLATSQVEGVHLDPKTCETTECNLFPPRATPCHVTPPPYITPPPA